MSARDSWDAPELERAGHLAREVRAIAGADATIFAARAPGRVNLIGEHTDYSGLPVLPVAIDRSTIIAAAANTSGEIILRNVDAAWPARSFRVERQIPSYPAGDWGNYVKAAVQGVIDHFTARGVTQFRGGTLFVDGRVPAAAGLSSSAALTVATALAFMAMNGLRLEPLETAAMVARSEWYVGTRAGGMDQAASLLGERDHALFIEFDPLAVHPVKMPSDAALVVADSLEAADKSGTVRAEYNRRVVECALAARILGQALGLEGVCVLGDVVKSVKSFDFSELVRVLSDTARAELGADLTDAARILGSSRDTLSNQLLGEGPARIALDPMRPLKILARARHVLGETSRVMRAVVALQTGRLDEMGALMNASHASLADDYECSTPALDALVECARRGGALGARLTGAGFGGSIVALCRTDDAPRVIAELDRGYYEKRGASAEQSRAVLHVGPGASVIEIAAA
ncbi:MAG TPA: galactokinase [Candidatus Binataceae bacterium]|nr:galactokinase [Candidatus Binataceae bacterium]